MLIQAQSDGLIEVYACGAGSLEIMKLSLTSKSADKLQIIIRTGTIFESLSASIQGMVVIKEKSVLLQPYEAGRTVEVDAACYNMERDVPGDDDALALSTTIAGGDLEKLLSLPDFQNESYRVQQFAIWTITDNPERDGYVGIGYFGFGSGPSDEEIAKIRILFEEAGISTGKYQALS